MTARVALFDMDRTLVRRDTASLYVRYQRDIGEAGWRDALKVAWWLAQYTVGVLDAERVAERAVSGYRGRSEQAMVDACRDWFARYVREHVCDEGRRAVERHRAEGCVTAIVTGATRYAAEPLAAELGIDHVVCTELEVEAGTFTGRVVKPMCYGPGKIELIGRRAADAGFTLDDASFYSDSITDLPLLERVARPVCVNPDARLRRIAQRRGWPIERW
jgi:HAD superfamily hydrolase (TIGR01490 family)